ncbi:MAG: phosphoribosylaminoimidazolesuccinocarboxamide synthase [Candidatus Aenigmarchaeota archaeon]|nr:phosphoribosylaminoimidazolesuccinocarboxamide synthase [Candidatus Aenigmarchaeota archaeon]
MKMTVTPGMVSSLQILKESDLPLPLRLVKRGKVRDVYADGRYVYLVTTDRISAFDVVSEQGVPYKGCALNRASAFGFEKTKGIVPNHFISVPDPNVTVAEAYTPVKVEAIARGYLVGSAWRQYEKGRREFFGTKLREGLIHGQGFDSPLFTPSTKADAGHDVDLNTWQDFADLVGSEAEAGKIRQYTLDLYAAGDLETRRHGGLLVDTKFEYGRRGGDGYIGLIDEAWTHDSSRFLRFADYGRLMEANAPPKAWAEAWVDKEYVRTWLSENGFRGEGKMPAIPDEVIAGASNRAVGSYEMVTGKPLPAADPPTNERIAGNLAKTGFLK